MSYKVLARKWRPDHFDEVVGQGHVARTLINSIEQDRVAHAYLFCGARGVGKTSTARILAKAMNCKQGPTPRPCYECSSCKEISSGQSVDVFEIDGASNRGINEIRELREGVRYAPSRDAYKIYIIDEVHMLTTEAFNALLKTLEEPPEHAIFIFATTEPQKIPVTILSRCQRFDFKRISQRDIVAHLEQLCEHEGLDAERAALQIIARQANGGMRDALSLLDQIVSFSGDRITEDEIVEILGVANRKHLFDLSQAVLSGDAERALVVVDEVDRYGYDLQQFASELVTHFRDLMVIAVVDEPEKVTQLTESELAVAREQIVQRPAELLHRYFSVIVDGAQQMSRSSYPKLIFEMTLVRLCELEPMERLDVLVERLALLESSLDEDGAPVEWPGPTGGGGSGGGSSSSGDGRGEATDSDEARDRGIKGPRQGEESADDFEEKGEPTSDDPTKQSELEVGPDGTEKSGDSSDAPRTDEPERSESATIPDIEGLESPQERWRAVVEYLRGEYAPVAHTCEHAVVDAFADGRVALHFEDGFKDLADDQERRHVVQRAIETLFGGDWELLIEQRDGSSNVNGATTLAQERQQDLQRRREQLKKQLRDSPVVQAAQELFEATDPRISVRLFDE